MSLDVHLHGERIGTLFAAGEDDYRFAYSPEVVERTGPGATLISHSLPVRSEPFGVEATRAYVGGLLPHGAWRQRLARDLGIDPADDFSLIGSLGGDCAGAVVFVEEGAAIEPAGDIAWLDQDEVDELVVQPPQRLADAATDREICFCLPGEHPKLALVRDDGGGRWAWPEPGLPSTHVLKPETGAYPDLAVNEMFCVSVLRRAGIPVVSTELISCGERRCLVSRRVDRLGDGPRATRIHQEDFFQALGYPPMDRAGEESDGPGFAESSGLLRAVGRLADVPLLLTAAIGNYVLGNGNAHGKNFALLFGTEGPRLAPMYDVVSTVVYGAPIHRGMVIAEDYESEHAYLTELAAVSEECNFDFEAFRELTSATAAGIGECLGEVAEQARAEGWHAPVVDEIVELAGQRAFGLGVEVEY
jgi:serine/threonine-protein kinase HipA